MLWLLLHPSETPILFAVAVQESAGVAWAELTIEVLIKACLIQTLERHTSFCLHALCNTNYFSKCKIKPMLFETLMSVLMFILRHVYIIT